MAKTTFFSVAEWSGPGCPVSLAPGGTMWPCTPQADSAPAPAAVSPAAAEPRSRDLRLSRAAVERARVRLVYRASSDGLGFDTLHLSRKIVRCQSLRATAVLSYITCLTWVYSSKEYMDMSLPKPLAP